MNAPVGGRDDTSIPSDWDVLAEGDGGAPSSSPAGDGSVPLLNLMAGSWADAVAMLAVCTAAIACLTLFGHHAPLSSLPWAAGMAAGWWLFATAVLLVVRQGTPGMLLAGVALSERVAARRLPAVVLAAAAQTALLGVPALGGSRNSLIAIAAGTSVEHLSSG